MQKLKWLKEHFNTIQSIADKLKNESHLFNDNPHKYAATFHKSISELEAAKDFLAEEIKFEEWKNPQVNYTGTPVKIVTERTVQYAPKVKVIATAEEMGLKFDPQSSITTKVKTKSVNKSLSNNPSFKDLTGMNVGDFTVKGLAPGLKGKWSVICKCGATETRTAKAINNPNNSNDKCVACRQFDYQLKRESWAEALVRISDFDCTGMTTGPCGECPSCIAANALEG